MLIDLKYLFFGKRFTKCSNKSSFLDGNAGCSSLCFRCWYCLLLCVYILIGFSVLVGGGDIAVQARAGRLLAGLLIIIGVVLTAMWSAVLTSNLTVYAISSTFNHPS